MPEKINEVKTKFKEKAAAKKLAVKSVITKAKGASNAVTSNRLKIMITVVERSKAEFYTDLIQSFDVNMQVVALAEGTADATTLRYLGLTNTEKVVIFSVIQENKLPDALATLEEKFKTVKNGNGIAFTVPMTSVIGTLIYGFLSNNRTVVKEDR